MRALLLTSILMTALTIPAAALADTFSFTPTGGSAITFSLNPPAPLFSSPPYYIYYFATITDSGQTTPFGNVTFYNPVTEAALGSGPLDFYIHDSISNINSYYTGAKLYSGSESSPTFLPGTYLLGAATAYNDSGTGVLIIDGGAAVTPEPSSLLLFGTGVLGLAGIARRRFFDARPAPQYQ